VVERALRAVRRADGVLARGPPLVRTLRCHRARSGAGAGARCGHQRGCRRPAGGALRPGVLRNRHDSSRKAGRRRTPTRAPSS
jgi:hypothetical protein